MDDKKFAEEYLGKKIERTCICLHRANLLFSTIFLQMDPIKAKQFVPEPSIYTYSTRDVIIYALGIGANPSDDLHFLYEGHPQFQVFPTFVVAPGLLAQSGQSMDWPGINFDLTKVLHGEQYIELFGQLPTDDNTRLRSEIRVIDILDKGKAALIIKEVTTFDDRTGQKLALQEFGIFQSGAGGFGGNRTSMNERKSSPIPDVPPNLVMEEFVQPNQAALYRQGSGDMNPLHIDPDFAGMAGFPQPILHGLCSLGISTRLILRAFAANQSKNLRSVKVRFSAPVLPGQTLVVEMWKNEDQRIFFQTKVKETGKVVISNGCVLLNEIIQMDKIGSIHQKQILPLKSAEIFKKMAEELATERKELKGIEAIMVYEIKNQGKVATKYTIELKEGKGELYEGDVRQGKKATVTVGVEDEDFMKLVGGQLDGTKAFLSGKLKVKGQLMLLQKLQTLLARARKEMKSKI